MGRRRGALVTVDLMTTFGGGKTHSLLAVYHRCAAGTPAEKLPGMRELLDGIWTSPSCLRRSTAPCSSAMTCPFSAAPRRTGPSSTPCGASLAWQLGGRKAFDLLRYVMMQSVPPTTTAIAELSSSSYGHLHSPCVILIDEWVAYLRQLWSRDRVPPAGTFDAHMTFVQSLTEATKSVKNALLVVSLPASDVVRDMNAS